MAHLIMLQGTMSNVGKTLITAGLCRIFKQDGYKTAPFKAQNMSLNSCITPDGREMSRAQVMQAEAAGINPSADMNPLLLKPTGHTGSQVILQGQVLKNMTAVDFYQRKKEFIPAVKESFERISKKADIVVIEGAGSPVELNLRKDDLVNMGFADISDAPVVLIGDIDPGGIFAQLLGTIQLFTEKERNRVKGFIVNKFRGDPELFTDGIKILEERSGLPVLGVVPYMEHFLSDEDSMSDRLRKKGKADEKLFDIAVIRYPRIANFTDLDVFDQWDDMCVRYVTAPEELGRPDLLILPGSKNTMEDLRWLRDTGFEPVIKSFSLSGPVLGICGGYQMLGESITDPEAVEYGGSMQGLGLLQCTTILRGSKQQRKTEDSLGGLQGIFKMLSGCRVKGYEIHMGDTFSYDEEERSILLREQGNVYGTYLHGLFDAPCVIPALRKCLAEARGLSMDSQEERNYDLFRENEYNRLASMLRKHLDIEKIYGIMGMNRV